MLYIWVFLAAIQSESNGWWLAGREDFRTNVNSLKRDLVVIPNMYLGTENEMDETTARYDKLAMTKNL